jgi:hypothetical protein
MTRVHGDFNGLFGDVLCLSHEDTCLDDRGERVLLTAGMEVTAVEEDKDESGRPDDLIATGIVEAAPDWLACKGSRWVLRIDSNGVRHESEITGK